MARTPNGVGPQRTAQVIFMIEPAIAGEVDAWQAKRGIRVKSDLHREIYLAGLAALREQWRTEHGNLSRAAVKRAVELAPRGAKSAAADLSVVAGKVLRTTGHAVANESKADRRKRAADETKTAKRAPRKAAAKRAGTSAA